MGKSKKKKKKHNKKNLKKVKQQTFCTNILNSPWKDYAIILLVIVIFFLLFLIVILRNELIYLEYHQKKKIEYQVTLPDQNYVFLGDSITDWYPLEEYYDGLPVINSGLCGYTTEDILNHMKEMVYDYNPSKVFILIGTNDYMYNKSSLEVVTNIEKIIDEIKKNRPRAEIYLESILPINKNLGYQYGRENETINETNEMLQKLCQRKRVTYIDIHSKLLDENNDFNRQYTEDGLHLNKDGYQVLTDMIKPYL